MELTYIADPGHGWLRVPKQEIVRLDLQDKISGYSYIDKDYLYLEEDEDAGKFVEAAIKAGIFMSLTDFHSKCTETHMDPCFIRDLDHYKKGHIM